MGTFMGFTLALCAAVANGGALELRSNRVYIPVTINGTSSEALLDSFPSSAGSSRKNSGCSRFARRSTPSRRPVMSTSARRSCDVSCW